MGLEDLRAELALLQDPERAEAAARGAAAGGLKHLGADLAEVRRLAQAHPSLDVDEVRELLSADTLEERLLAVFALVRAYRNGSDDERRGIFDEVIARRSRLTHWDLVDLCAEHIVGAWLWGARQERDPWDQLQGIALVPHPWERRLALVAALVRARTHPTECFALVASLCADQTEPVQQALGWLMREISKRHPAECDGFLRSHYRELPKQTLRTAIERLPEDARQFYVRARML
jgi:3-methyladenine DNA glycosylase AlkD